MVKARSVAEINASLQTIQVEPPKTEQKQEPKQPKTDYKAKAHELVHQVTQLEIKVKELESKMLNFEIVEMCVNNYLKGYKTAYKNNKNNDLSKVKTDYEKVLKEKEKLKELIK